MNHGSINPPMKKFKLCTGVLLLVASVFWPFVAVWMSARQLIYLSTEFSMDLLCYLAAFAGAMFLSSLLISRWRNVLFFLLISSFAFVATYKAQCLSDRLFAPLMTSAISDLEWNQMASEILDLARSRRETGVVQTDLPKSFKPLGLVGDCHGVTTIDWESGNIVGVRVSYGSHNRRWGLLAGPDSFLNDPMWSKYRRIRVATNASFFIGPD